MGVEVETAGTVVAGAVITAAEAAEVVTDVELTRAATWLIRSAAGA